MTGSWLELWLVWMSCWMPRMTRVAIPKKEMKPMKTRTVSLALSRNAIPIS